MNKFEIKDDFYLNEEKYKVLSAAIHYFRTVPEYWRDRLEKIKASGCNTIETYVPWNLHEKKKGQFNFEGILNLDGFVKLAQELGLYVIIRPTPYICGEWEFGGLPAWLLKEDGMRLREMYEPYLKHVREYYDELFKIITPLQITNGGPIIMVQIENEYGYYGNDKEYLKTLRDYMVERGINVPFVTSDGPWGEALEAGSLEGVLATGNFGSGAKEHFKKLRKFTNDGPLMCMEFWIGWFDAWGEEHHTRPAEDVKKELDELLEEGHANIYMFHGGTNFGFMNGANYYDELKATVTSYDYDSALTEWGATTPKYEAIKEVLSKHTTVPEVKLSTDIKFIDYGKFDLVEKVSLFSTLDSISKCEKRHTPVSMEKLDQGYGYVLYRANVGAKREVENFRIMGCRDRAQIFVNENHVATKYTTQIEEPSKIYFDKEEDNKLDILVENMGRVNFGEKLRYQRKGIDDGVIIDKHYHYGWEHYSLELENVEAVDFSGEYRENTPAFYKYNVEVSEIGDTFLSTEGFGKGCAFINGFNLGRFYEAGPQKALYIPGPLLKEGKNEIVIFETEGKAIETIELSAEANIG